MTSKTNQINEWVKAQPHWFSSWQIDEAFNLTSKAEKATRRKYLQRLCDKNVLIRGLPGVFRYNPILKVERLKLKAL